MTTDAPSHLKYRPEVDGLRAIAVLSVILFHARVPGFSGGYVGVDVFFVISGYLITLTILDAIAKGRFSIVDFYERRARRILPALFLVVGVTMPFAVWLLAPVDLHAYAKSLIAVATFSSNVLFYRSSGYFAPDVELLPLLHTWSLAVEEQFYVLFPLVMAALWPRRARIAVVSLVVATVASLAFSAWSSGRLPELAFYLLPTRTCELLSGALLAVMHALGVRTDQGRGATVRAALGLALVSVAIFVFDDDTVFPGVAVVVPTFGAWLLIANAGATDVVGRVLASPPLRGVGLVSYSAYLWHQPILAFVHRARDTVSPALTTGLIALTFVLAWLSWKFVETPFRDRARFSRRQIFALSLVGSVALVAIGLAGHVSKGFAASYAARLDEEAARVHALVEKHTDGVLYDQMQDDGACRFWARTVTESFKARFTACAKKGRAIVVLGDSHAMNVFNLLSQATTAAGHTPFLVGLSQGGCRPVDAKPKCHYAPFSAFLEAERAHIERVLFHQSGSYLVTDRHGRFDSDAAFVADDTFTVEDETISRTVAWAGELQTRVPLTFIGPFPESRRPFEDPVRLARRGLTLNPVALAANAAVDDALAARTRAAEPPIPYVSLHALLALDPKELLIDDCLTYRDRDHMSLCGERLFAERLVARGALPQLGLAPTDAAHVDGGTP